MKALWSFLLILFFSFLGEMLHWLLPLPVPASIYGLALLFAALVVRAVSYESVKPAAHFLIGIMQALFVPVIAGLMTSARILLPVLLPYCVILMASTLVVMVCSGRVTQALLHPSEKEPKA